MTLRWIPDAPKNFHLWDYKSQKVQVTVSQARNGRWAVMSEKEITNAKWANLFVAARIAESMAWKEGHGVLVPFQKYYWDWLKGENNAAN